MITRTVEVVPAAGIHARPAAACVRAANAHDARVQIGRADEEPVPADSIVAVTGLDVRQGETVELHASGAEAAAVVDAIEAVLTEPVEE